MKSILLGLGMLCACLMGYTQENPLPKLDVGLFLTDHKQIDTSAHAIVIYEHGRTDLEYSESDRGMRVVHSTYVRIKILDKEGANAANVTIPLYKYGSDMEYVREIQGKTINFENGKLITDELKKEAIFTEKASQYNQLVKFTLPNIKDNSIIEYSYRLYSPAIRTYRTWYFQSEFPKIHSEYVSIIPATFDYNINLKGFLSLADRKSEVLHKHFLLNGVRQDCSKFTYTMKDIPAFKEEDYMLAPINYISSINYELRTYLDPNGPHTNFSKKWSDIDQDLMQDKEFGGQIKNKSAFKDILPEIIGNKESALDKAKAIYYYIQKNIVWNHIIGKFAEVGIKKALETKKGNIGDINFSLIAALNAAEIEAFPVIISTRQNGMPNYLYPSMSDFNAVICLAKIDGKDYLLDASKKFLPFGELSIESINDRGRVIYSKNQSDWIDLKNVVPAKKSINILGQLDSTGKITGTIRVLYSGLDALFKRREIDKYNSFEEYEEGIMEKISSMRVLGVKVENLENLDKDFIETLSFEMDLRDNYKEANFLLNPTFYERTTKNPFKLEERTYHVDLGAPQLESFNISISLPKGFVNSSKPKDTSMALPEGTAKYIFKSLVNEDLLMVQQSIALNKAIYNQEEYFHLKEFFARIIQQQMTDFQFKKI